jgi:type IV secretory pathway VirB10-like protein
MRAFDFGRLVARANSQKQAAGPFIPPPPAMTVSRPPLPDTPPLKPAPIPRRVVATPGPVNSKVPPLKDALKNAPAATQTATAKQKTKQDYRREYDAWRASQGLTGGGADGTASAIPLNQIGSGGKVPQKPR